ncbi:hypothetical protein VE00_11002 [Pseudogymnoascus sp. WSF 3629]|nr:hypothetical protein VE00_11002 [Pseudogymnoascus sp. WSF 3629]
MNNFYGILFSLFAVLAYPVSSAHSFNKEITFIPAAIQPGPSKGQFVSSASGLDSPKVIPINASAYDWWYFDAVSDDAQESIVIVFYTVSAAGFPGGSSPTSVNSVGINAQFRNGTSFSVFIPATSATIVTVENGTSGHFRGTGCAWISAPNMARYLITVDSPNYGVQGTFQLESIAPAHYPCGSAVEGQNLEIMPNVGWANAVPDSQSAANFVINGSEFSFKNWGIVPFTQSVGSWYWGHGRLGNYSIVWYDALTPDKTEYTSFYIARDGEIMNSQCSGIQVRPNGANSTYPPTRSSGNPAGFSIVVDLGDDGTLEVDVSNQTTLLSSPLYKRWTGQLKGRIRGSEVLTGVALYEEFALFP